MEINKLTRPKLPQFHTFEMSTEYENWYNLWTIVKINSEPDVFISSDENKVIYQILVKSTLEVCEIFFTDKNVFRFNKLPEKGFQQNEEVILLLNNGINHYSNDLLTLHDIYVKFRTTPKNPGLLYFNDLESIYNNSRKVIYEWDVDSALYNKTGFSYVFEIPLDWYNQNTIARDLLQLKINHYLFDYKISTNELTQTITKNNQNVIKPQSVGSFNILQWKQENENRILIAVMIHGWRRLQISGKINIQVIYVDSILNNYQNLSHLYNWNDFPKTKFNGYNVDLNNSIPRFFEINSNPNFDIITQDFLLYITIPTEITSIVGKNFSSLPYYNKTNIVKWILLCENKVQRFIVVYENGEELRFYRYMLSESLKWYKESSNQNINASEIITNNGYQFIDLENKNKLESIFDDDKTKTKTPVFVDSIFVKNGDDSSIMLSNGSKKKISEIKNKVIFIPKGSLNNVTNDKYVIEITEDIEKHFGNMFDVSVFEFEKEI